MVSARSPMRPNERLASGSKNQYDYESNLSRFQARLAQTVVSFVPWTEFETEDVFGHPGESVIPAAQWWDGVSQTPLMQRLGGPFRISETANVFGCNAHSCIVTSDLGQGLAVEARICLLQDDALFLRLICDLALRLRCRIHSREAATTILPHPMVLEAVLIQIRASISTPLGRHPGPAFADLRRQAARTI